MARLSGESHAFFPVMRHHSMRGFLDWVRAEMVPDGRRFKLLLGEMEIDLVLVETVRPPHIEHWPGDGSGWDFQWYPKVQMRHYGIARDTTLTLVLI